MHLAVDPLGDLLALHVTPVNAHDRDQVAALAAAVQDAPGAHVEVAYVDQGSTGDRPRQAAAARGIALAVVTLPDAQRGFVLLPRRWVIERDVGWLSRCRRLARDQERFAGVLNGVHRLACIMVMWKHVLPIAPLL